MGVTASDERELLSLIKADLQTDLHSTLMWVPDILAPIFR